MAKQTKRGKSKGNGKGKGNGKVRRRARPDSELTLKMRKQGYLLCTEVAKRVGVHKATVYRWIKDELATVVDHNGAYYVKWESVYDHMGDVAEIIGLARNVEDLKSLKELEKEAVEAEAFERQAEAVDVDGEDTHPTE